ncbi:hypothetical protein [Nocardioides albus]|uniref:Lipoprotein-anchoring transpeptidase ErfK/SrfK n=1 Tax=Nocardioides albus TaxID=1841 RepID=A0A7W5AAA6_9ACTN|nr:hypothetical protein [Nocardioides albus]MBB3092269.1 lipoprotein-anchoring transpeptidase ErfK/SrfK [Nocardioides albus]GGU11651.1 hypothetical protein GCM10007979_06910 [Nocardioides albus]
MFRMLSRRTAVALAVVTPLAASACSASETLNPVKAPPPSTPPAPANPDQSVIDATVAEILGADEGAPAAFVELHRIHIEALAPTKGVQAATTGRWQERQLALVTTLTSAAGHAADPQLITLLASAAAAQQQLLHGRGLA